MEHLDLDETKYKRELPLSPGCILVVSIFFSIIHALYITSRTPGK